MVSILSSKVFTFLVGEEKQPFTVHSAVLAQSSKVIDVLLNGKMKEAVEGVVEWPDMDVQTFLRLTQWAYTGTYDVPEPNIIPPDSNIATEGDSKPADESALTGLDRGTAVVQQFKSDNKYPSPRLDLHVRININSQEDFTDIFFCHARLYVTADKYKIVQLKQLALYWLYTTLRVFRLYRSKLSSIIDLVLYVCENTGADDELCNMLALYVACIAEDLAQADDEGLKTLIETEPSFAYEWMKLRLTCTGDAVFSGRKGKKKPSSWDFGEL